VLRRQFAIDEANAKGGVDGRKVEVQIADDEGTPDAGRRVAEKLARDGYNLLIGAIPSSISLALAPNLERWDAAYFVVASKATHHRRHLGHAPQPTIPKRWTL
jgi:branched-chain amino acid transport system substrate-binding protein